MINLFNRQYKILPSTLVATGVITLMLLGTWQMNRLREKEHFINTIEQNVASDAVELLHTKTPTPYDKIKVSGHFSNDKNAFLYGRRSASPEKDGYYLLSAFKSDSGKTYLVSRGWFPQSVKQELEKGITEQVSETIEAIVLPGEKKNYFVPENDKKNNIWFTLDLNMATELIATNVSDFYLMQINSTTLPNGAVPLRTTHLNKVRNDHLEYAMTWYILGVCLLFMFMIYGCKKK